MIHKAQLHILDEDDRIRHVKALGLYEKVRDRVMKQLGTVRNHLKELLGDQAESDDDEDVTPARNLSQHERDRRAALTAAQLSYAPA